MKKKLITGGTILIALILGVFLFWGEDNKDAEVLDEPPLKEIVLPASVIRESIVATQKPQGEEFVYDVYNYDFVDEHVKGILNGMLGLNGKTAFYLPPTGYINASRGSNFGVAFGLNNPNPSGENYFEFDWTVDDSVVSSCGVSIDVAQGWIERGWTSFGKIPKGWIDHMTVYFSFPSNIKPCNVKYNFEIKKDGFFYDSKTIEFNLI